MGKYTLDHIAFRVKDKDISKQIFILMGYEVVDSFLPFNNDKVSCIVLKHSKYDLPEIFISEGLEDSIVKNWINKNGSGVHHIAFKVDNLDKEIGIFKSKGIKFSSENPIVCEDLKQIFTEPLDFLGGICIELLERSTHGFCKDSVKQLMETTK